MTSVEPIDGRTRRAEAQRETRRAHILKTAIAVFADKGYHQTRISDIIQAAGIARGTFYLYFESKSAIFLELLDSLMRQLRATFVGVDTGPTAPPAEEQLLTTLMEVVRALDYHRPLMTILFREAVGLDDEVDQKLRAFYQSLHEWISESLKNGQRIGLVRDLDTDVVSSCILGSVKYLLEQHIFVTPDEDVDVERIGRAVLDYNLRGVLAGR